MDGTASTTPRPEERLPADLVRPYGLGFYAAVDADDPYDVIIPKVHEGPELFWDPKGSPRGDGAWIFRRSEDIRAAFLDEEHFTAVGAVGVLDLIGLEGGLIPAEIDLPEHSWYRAVLNPLFSPKRMKALSQVVDEESTRLIAQIRDKGECNFIPDFAVPLPVGIFLSLLGLPLSEIDTYVRWNKTITGATDLSKKVEALQLMSEHLKEALAERRKSPRDDVLTTLVTAEVDGRRMNESEQLRSAIMLFFAGLDTVTSGLSWMIKYLAEHPDDQEKLRNAPELLPSATEEFLRAFAPLTVNKRCRKRFVARNGVVIEPGERVLLSCPLANRDPEAYPEPNRIIFDRNATHSTFAYGIHRCIGSHLARQEVMISMRNLLAQLPTFRRKDDARLPMRFGSVLTLTELPLVWDA
jgi:cytochrome P450